jgi:hypothetical protein
MRGLDPVEKGNQEWQPCTSCHFQKQQPRGTIAEHILLHYMNMGDKNQSSGPMKGWNHSKFQNTTPYVKE